MMTISKNLKYTLTIVLLFSTMMTYAQKSMKKAEKLMNKYEYAKAAELYETKLNFAKASDKDIRNLAYCYIHMNNTEKAVKYLASLIEKGSATQNDLKIYADLLKQEGRYDEAISIYTNLNDDFTQNQITSSNLAKEWIADTTVLFEVENVKDLNSKNSDFSLTKFGNKFLFTSDRENANIIETENKNYSWTGLPFLKLYEVEIIDSVVQNIKLIDSINDAYHNGPAVFDEVAQVLYFTKTITVEQKQKKLNPDPTSWFPDKEHNVITDRLEIYSAKLIDGQFVEITPFQYNNKKEYSVGHPTLSPDGNILYFVSDMPGGVGETDIYYCVKNDDGTWDTPQNAGDIINTPGKEMFPVIEKNGDLYFSSDGHSGMGGLDIFRSTGSEATWSEPENLKYPFNSSKDDFAILFTEEGKTGFFTSNRNNGQGADDIYSFKYVPPPPPPVPTTLILSVTTWEKMDNGTLAILTDEISVMHTESSDPNQKMKITNVGDGKYEAVVNCDSKYIVGAASTKFFATPTQTFETHCETFNDTVFLKFVLERIVLQKEIVIENIYYDYNKANIRADAALELNKIVALLKENPAIIIELGSHTDSRGSDKYNLDLSQRRAESAVQYIIDNGISQNRISAKGYGETKPVNKCTNGVRCSEKEHQMNRRTEFKVTGFVEGVGDVDMQSLQGTDIHIDAKPGETIEPNSSNTTSQQAQTGNNSFSAESTGLVYRVQFLTSTNKLEANDPKFKGLENVNFYFDGGMYKYTYGEAKTLAEARTLVTQLKNRGIDKAFTVPFYNNQRITMEEAKKYAAE